MDLHSLSSKPNSIIQATVSLALKGLSQQSH
jgi:hypothetical protein